MDQEASPSARSDVQAKKHKMNPEAVNGDSEVCPVCLLDDVSLVKGRCQHKVCLPCLERIVSVPVQRSRNLVSDVLPDEDAHLDVPTRGRCPMCRGEICLFDLESDMANDGTKNSSTDLTTLAIVKNHDILATALKGRVYVPNRSRAGDRSLHFPSDAEEVGRAVDGQETGPTLPYIDFSEEHILKFANNDKLPDRKYFEPDCHFHESTRTFHGRLKWGEACNHRVSGSLEWEYSIAFSSDFRFISRGVIIQKRQTCNDSTCERLDCKFPLEGRWRVSWPDNKSRSDKTCIVHNNRWIGPAALGGEDCAWQLSYQENKYPVVAFPDLGILEKAAHNLAEKEIKVGESLEFLAVTSNEKLRMIWVRETKEPTRDHLRVLSFGSESSQLCYHELSEDAVNSRSVEYHSDTVWGNTFCQASKVGLASYHFMQTIEDGAYISYEHERTSVWPPLDNGNPIPSKIWFTETSFDPETRIFRGKIDWEGTHRTTWQGCRWWRYEMQFDQYFSCIMGGHVKSVASGSELERDMSLFGVELLYINAGLVEHCHESNDFDLLERSIILQERSIASDVGAATNTRMRRMSCMFNLLIMFQGAMGENGNIQYPHSFRRSDHNERDYEEWDE